MYPVYIYTILKLGITIVYPCEVEMMHLIRHKIFYPMPNIHSGISAYWSYNYTGPTHASSSLDSRTYTT